MFFFLAIKQNPTPQLKVLIISFSDILFDLIHLNILITLILDKSKFKVNPFGNDLNKFSIRPPPVMCARIN